MKPAHERNQECLPPKKRDLPVNNNNNSSGGGSTTTVGGGTGSTAAATTTAAAGEETAPTQSAGASSDVQIRPSSGEWLRTQQGLHYSLEGAEAASGLPPDQYSMLYKVALPSVSYPPTSLHPVLSHISPAYTVPSPLLQHAGLSYPPLGYTQIPHSSLQFVSSPYAAVPYAVSPGFVHNPLISPQSAIAQPHAVPHLVPYPSVIQEGVATSPPQAQVPAHAYAKLAAAAGGVPLVLSSEQAAAAAVVQQQQQQQAQLGTVGVLSTAELSPRGVPVFYHPPRAQVTREALERERERDRERELNGGDREQPGVRELVQDSTHLPRNVRLLQAAPVVPTQEPQQQQHPQERSQKGRRLDERASPGQRSTPDMDLEVQQVVGRLASPLQSTGRKDAPHGPLNLSQTSQRGREVVVEGRTVFVPPSATTTPPTDPRTTAQVQQGHHAVILANGQPVLIPLDYHHPHHAPPQPHNLPGTLNDTAAKAVEQPIVAPCPPDRPGGQDQQPAPVSQAAPAQTVALTPVSLPPPSQAPVPSAGPSHFMKGAIIQLATGELKRVEDLQTQDFVRSAEVSGGLKIDSSMVVDVRASQQRPGLVALHFSVGEQQSKVTIDVPPEHPFFVFGQGWSSCNPERTAQLYGLPCHHLQVGDVCVSITLQQSQPQQQQQTAALPKAQPQQQPQQQPQALQHHVPHPQQPMTQARTSIKPTSTSGSMGQPMGPPAPQHTRPHSQSHFRMERSQRERERERERESGDRDEVVHVGTVTGHTEAVPRPHRTSSEHPRSHSSYYLHTEGHSRHEHGGTGGGGPSALASSSAAQRRWSAPGSQRYAIKSEEGRLGGPGLQGASRLSFIPQEVKLSIEGRSNAGK